MRSIFLLLACLLATPAASRAATGPDRALWEKALLTQSRLSGDPARQKKTSEWDRVISVYRNVVHKYPKSPYCDDALLAIGDLYQGMAERFPKSRTRYRTQAADAYRSIIAEYPSSSRGDDALYKVFQMASASQDARATREAAQAYLDTFPRGKSAKLVKDAVRKKSPAEARALPSPPPPGLAQVYGLRYWSGENSTRVVVQLEHEVPIKHERIDAPDRLWIDLAGARLHPNLLTTNRLPIGDVQLDGVRISQYEPKVVRVVLDFKKAKDHAVFYLRDPPRLVIDVRGGGPEKPSNNVASGGTNGAEPFPTLAPGEAEPTSTPIPSHRTPAAAAPPAAPPAASPAPTPIVIAANARPSPTATPTPPAAPRVLPIAPVVAPTTAAPAPEREARNSDASGTPTAQPNRNGNISIIRQLGLSARTIVIDAGHGGHDPGTIGPSGLEEKDLVLDVARRLEKLVRSELRAEVIMTRSTDVFIPLEERTAIANSRGADLFLSIHANSSPNRSASGIETYFLSLARDRDAEQLAMRENAISAATVKDLQGLLKEMLKGKVDESRDFATSVQQAMVSNLKPHNPLVHDRKVRTAPFYVLIGANMPSILAEIAFVSHPQEEKLLKTERYREEIARSLLSGVKAYLEALNRAPIPQLTTVSRTSKVAPGTRVLPPVETGRRTRASRNR
jgi:N-acetylmuramoyl-L-alanine amidase